MTPPPAHDPDRRDPETSGPVTRASDPDRRDPETPGPATPAPDPSPDSGGPAPGGQAPEGPAPGGPDPVLLEIRPPHRADVDPAVLELPGFHPDPDFTPVRMTSGPDDGGPTVIVRGRLDPDAAEAMGGHPDVVRVWADTPIAPISPAQEGQEAQDGREGRDPGPDLGF